MTLNIDNLTYNILQFTFNAEEETVEEEEEGLYFRIDVILDIANAEYIESFSETLIEHFDGELQIQTANYSYTFENYKLVNINFYSNINEEDEDSFTISFAKKVQ